MRGAVADGENLLSARLSRGLTQEQLAALADVDVKTVRKAEQGRRLDVGTLARLALALETELHCVIRRQNSETELQAARRKTVERWQAAWDARDQEAILALYHERIVLHLPGGPPIPFSGRICGKEAVRRAQELAWATAQTVPQKAEDYTLIIGEKTVILHGSRGVRLPSGDELRLSNTHLFVFEGELIIEHRVDYDTLGFSRALELL